MKRGLALLALLPGLAMALPEHAPRAGGIAVVDVGDGGRPPEVRFGDRRVAVVAQDGRWFALAGIPLDTRGQIELTVAGQQRAMTVALEPHAYREQHLSVAPQYVTPGEAALERIATERELLDAAIARFTDQPLDGRRLLPPVPGSRSTSFGSRRFFNNEPRSPHRGMDLSAASGTPVRAPADGVVALVGDFYFTGKTVVLDHGQGLTTLYAHLSDSSVQADAAVTRGDVIGTVGASGRVTGPHLHFATYLNGTAVDPALWLEAPATEAAGRR